MFVDRWETEGTPCDEHRQNLYGRTDPNSELHNYWGQAPPLHHVAMGRRAGKLPNKCQLIFSIYHRILVWNSSWVVEFSSWALRKKNNEVYEEGKKVTLT